MYEELIDDEMIFSGIQVSYCVVCPTKLWLFSRFLMREKESELIEIGKIIQDFCYPHTTKNLILDQKISIDFIKRGKELVVVETKKSEKMEKAHKFQLLYYLYYLKYKKGIENAKGIITYPMEKKVIEVTLTEEIEKEIERTLEKIKRIVSSPYPPLPTYKKYCRKCAYFEFCFGDT